LCMPLVALRHIFMKYAAVQKIDYAKL